MNSITINLKESVAPLELKIVFHTEVFTILSPLRGYPRAPEVREYGNKTTKLYNKS
ncbi:MAG: hypothetical protein R6U46_12750 [Marinilabilia sp.]